jgi:hypothetical protein
MGCEMDLVVFTMVALTVEVLLAAMSASFFELPSAPFNLNNELMTRGR